MNGNVHLARRLRAFGLPLLAFVFLIANGASQAAVVRVKQTAPGPIHDGTSWSQAYLSVGDATSNARSGDEIWVARGTYGETLTLNGAPNGDRDLAIYGGFIGTETSRTQRNWISNATIIDGNGIGNVITILQPTQALHLIVDGFSIRNSKAGGRGISATGSSALQADLDIDNCVLTGNGTGLWANYAILTARESTFTTNGIGIDVSNIISNASSTPPASSTISSNTVSANQGDGIHVTTSNVEISTNVITGNSGQGVDATGTLTLTNNTVNANRSGGILIGSGTPTIQQNNVYQNGSDGINVTATAFNISANTVADNSGTGIVLSLTSSSKGSITANTLSGNTSGGVRTSGGVVRISRNVIKNNSASQGGGLYVSGGVPLLDANFIAGNSVSGTGGGIYSSSPGIVIVGNTVTGNSSPAVGGGIYLTGALPVVANTIVAFNTSGIEAPATTLLRNNDVFGNSSYNYGAGGDQTGSNGNVSVDPQIAGAPARDPHLQPSSPLINAGNVGDVPDSGLDIDGQNRVINTKPDIGADESDGTPWPANLIVRVSPFGVDSYLNDGSTWALAKRTVQAAIDAVAGGGEVWVAAGDYGEHITLKTGVAVYGGFAGVETQRDTRDWVVNASILDGGASGNVVTIPVGTGATEILDGFLVQHQATAGTGISAHQGGITAAHNTYQANYNGIDASDCLVDIADSEATADNSGIGVANSSGKISGMNVHDNTGTGIAASAATGGTVLVLDNTILHNADSGIKASGGRVRITRNQIRSNYGSSGGGISLTNGTPLVDDNAIFANGVSGLGGGIYSSSATAIVVNNTITGNSAPCYAGGGIYATGGTDTISNNIVCFNTSGVVNDPVTPCTFTFRANDVYGSASANYTFITPDPTGVGGNISTDPRLAGPPSRDLHVQPDSPCRNVGYNPDVPQDAVDIDGQARIQGGTVDIGVDESDGTAWPGNLIIRVAPTGNNANSGLSWSKPKQTVQAGIDAVKGGGEVWVRKGLFAEHLIMAPGVALYGGFSGSEINRDQRNPATNVTVLDGGNTGDVIAIPAGTGATELIDGFTVQHQSRTGNGISADRAGVSVANNTLMLNSAGVSLSGSWADVRNNVVPSNDTGIQLSSSCGIVEGNTVNGSGSDGINTRNGSSISQPILIQSNTVSSSSSHGISTTGNPLITENLVSGNAAGGISCSLGSPEVTANTASGNGGYGIMGSDGEPTISGNTVMVNSGYGIKSAPGASASPTIDANIVWENSNSGIQVTNGNPRISNNDIQGNLGTMGSGISVSGGAPVIEKNLIATNGTAQGGGGIYANGASATIINNVIRDNDGYGIHAITALASGNANLISGNNGPGIWLESFAPTARPTIGNNTITSNLSSGLRIGGGAPMIANNMIVRNASPDNGGGIWLSGASADIINDTLVDNAAALQGGGLYIQGGSSRLGNTIVAFNSSGVALVSGSLSVSFKDTFGNASSDYLGMPDPTHASGNIGVDPLLVNRATGNYHLRTGSPLINSGSNALVLPGWSDIDGDLRILDGIVDIGADEYDANAAFTVEDVTLALKIWGGLTSGAGALPRLNINVSGNSTGRIDNLDAISIARKLNGLTQ